MARRLWLEWGPELLVALMLALLFRAGVAEAQVVPTESMVPTIFPGDWLLVEKVVYVAVAL